MTQLLALSFDSATSPSIRLKAPARREGSLDATYGWGFAWYPSEGSSAMVIKDPTTRGHDALTNVLSDWERFSATVFLAHLRGAAKRTTQQDTHPFQRAYAGRDWVLTHNGDLRHGYRDVLQLPSPPSFEPVGRTDSEHLFCWLLERLKSQGIRRLRDLDHNLGLAWLRQINGLGTLNLVLSDGDDLVVYSDAFGYRPLYWIRHTPPHPLIAVSDDEVEIKIGTAADMNRTVVVVSTRPLSDGAWKQVPPGAMLIARRGSVVFESPGVAPGWLQSEGIDPEVLADVATGDRSAAMRLSRQLEVARRELVLEADGESVLPLPLGASSGAPQAVATGLFPEGAWLARDVPSSNSPGLHEAAQQLAAPEVLLAGQARELGDDQRDVVQAPRILETWHETIYTYTEPIDLSTHLFRLRPVHDIGQEVLDFRMIIVPDCRLRTYEDVFGNIVTETRLGEPYSQLRILAQARVKLIGQARPRLRTGGESHRLPLLWMPWQRQMMTPYLLPPELPESQLRELSDYAMSFADRQDGDLVETLKDINRTLYVDYNYEPSSTKLETTPWEVYTERQGVCQDFSNLFIAMARLLGIPARYRVGYIFTGGKYQNARQGDASHAWVEVYLPGVGWRGFDPTNGTLAVDDHVRVACGRNYRDATPTQGVIYKGGKGVETLEVIVKVADVSDHMADVRRFTLGV